MNRQLQAIMDKAFREVLEMNQQKKVGMRDAAYMLALKRIVDVM